MVIGKPLGMATTDAIDLTVYLIRVNRDDVKQICPSAGLRQFQIKFSGGLVGTLFVRSPRHNVPKWARFFESQVDLKQFGKGSSPAAALIVGVDERWFAMTFGPAGRFIVDQDIAFLAFFLLMVLWAVLTIAKINLVLS